MEAAFSLVLAVLIATEPHSNIDDVKMCAVIFLLSLGWSAACRPVRRFEAGNSDAPKPRRHHRGAEIPLLVRQLWLRGAQNRPFGLQSEMGSRDGFGSAANVSGEIWQLLSCCATGSGQR